MVLLSLYKKLFALIIIFISFSGFAFSQSKSEIENLLTEVCKVSDSKDIIKSEYASKISDYQEEALEILPEFFTDDSKTDVYSKCLKRKLSRGEVAVILCDRIEIMPYFQLTGIQNCIFSFCKDNPNFVEAYLDTIKKQSIKKFKEKYVLWLHSEERKNTWI
ncbi:hypothetical protein CLV62_12158 [Dysgonomonas alginatilytica]|uniref:Uncharacterized protein n=1 Tax=Dysgonomonas alginatilytica TaxID=1605892 RepID=A0A2V3PND9_9BACT|nr:hypothetical protein [Dysgonomonas alginatilytica]PXV62235.1 hypothetical protein CLV62_12158 [Dysgonomonas alginatilytica]